MSGIGDKRARNEGRRFFHTRVPVVTRVCPCCLPALSCPRVCPCFVPREMIYSDLKVESVIFWEIKAPKNGELYT